MKYSHPDMKFVALSSTDVIQTSDQQLEEYLGDGAGATPRSWVDAYNKLQ